MDPEDPGGSGRIRRIRQRIPKVAFLLRGVLLSASQAFYRPPESPGTSETAWSAPSGPNYICTNSRSTAPAAVIVNFPSMGPWAQGPGFAGWGPGAVYIIIR